MRADFQRSLTAIFIVLRNLIFKRQQPNCVLASINQTSDAKPRVDPKPRMTKSIDDITYQSASLVPRENLYIRTRRRWKGVESVRIYLNPLHFPEAESIFPAMFGHLIDGSQNAVWRIALEGEISQNYENHSK